MILVLKKIVLIMMILLMSSISVFAKGEFYVYGEDDIDFFCKTFDMDDCDIADYFEQNNITYFACNKDNTKQIKMIETVDDFSKSVFDMLALSDESILDLASELSGVPNTKGEIVEYGDRKFLKTEHQTEDSGGKFILTQYVTVEKSQKMIISFCTAENVDNSYILENFEQLAKPQKDYALFLVLGFGLFAFVGIWVLVLLIRDFKKNNA